MGIPISFSYDKLNLDNTLAYGNASHSMGYEALTTAPAAFGVYEPSPFIGSKYQQGYGMVTGHQSMLPMEHYPSEPAYDMGMMGSYDMYAQYEFEPFTDFIQDEDKDGMSMQSCFMSSSMHINPAMIECAHFADSPHTLLNDASQQSLEGDKKLKKTASRSTGQPTNVVPTAKMDRKTLKRLRNRISASRCRIKKKEWISEMEEQGSLLMEEQHKLLHRLRQLEDAVNHCRQVMSSANLPMMDTTGLGISQS